MNSVYDRPLFANKKQKRRDARTKLLNMGGIVASSPELMQAVSQAPRSMNQGGYIPGYDEGGHVHPHNTQQQISNTFQPVRSILKDTGGQIGNLATVPANYFNSLLAGTGGLSTDVLSGLVSAFGFTDAGKNLADSADRAYKTSGEQVRAGNANLLKGLGIDVSEDPSAFMANMTGSANASTETEVDNTSEANREESLGGADQLNAARLEEQELLTQTQTALAQAEQLLKDKTLSEEQKANAAALLIGEDLKGTDKERALQYKSLIEDVFGKKTGAKTTKALNKQLIGWTIAAGKSPRAVQNIAAGFIAGAKAEKVDLEKEQARTDAMSTLALNQMFKEDAASALAASNLATAEARAGTGSRAFRSGIDAFDNARTAGLDAWNSGIAEMGDKYRPPDAREGESITQYANRLGREAVEARKLLGGSNVDVSNTAGSTTKKIDPGAANALIALKGNPTPERIAAFKKYYPNDIGMLKTIGLK